MAEIKLTDFVLLASEFRMWPRGAMEAEGREVDDFYPPHDVAQISASVVREESAETEGADEPEQWILYVHLKIDDESFPQFMVHLTVGVRFEVAEEGLDPARAESTLVWLCYPYLRELVASISGRSPLPPYYLPALTMLPDLAALGHEATEAAPPNPETEENIVE